VNKTFIGFHLPASAPARPRLPSSGGQEGSAGGKATAGKPEANEATLSVFDETGRVVYQQKGQFAKGENTISLDRALINTVGLLYYKLETATDSATKKMIQAK